MALDEREEVREHLEDVDENQGTNLDDRRMQVRYLLSTSLSPYLNLSPLVLVLLDSNTRTSSSSFNLNLDI